MTDPQLHYQMVRLSQDVWRVQDNRGHIYLNEVPYERAKNMMLWLYSLAGPLYL